MNIIDLAWLSTFPLRQLDEENKPIDSASSCLYSVDEKKYLIMCRHTFETDKPWAVEKQFDKNGTHTWRIGTPYFLKILNKTSSVEHIDIAGVRLPDDFESLFQSTDTNGIHSKARPRISINLDNSFLPNTNELYCFCGQAELDSDGFYLFSNLNTFNTLKFTYQDYWYYYFTFVNEQPTEEKLRGCSGAPVINKDGLSVALVCGSPDKGRTLKCVKLPFILPCLIETINNC